VGQLSAALKTLKGLPAALKTVKGQPTTPGQPDATDATDATEASATDVAPATDDEARTATDTPSDEMLELLASLGVVLVPNAQTAPLPSDGSAKAGASLPANANGLPVPATLLQAAAQTQSSTKAEATPGEAAATTSAPLTAEGVKDHTAPAPEMPREATPPADTQANPAVPLPQPGQAPVPMPTTAQLPTIQPQFQGGADSGFPQGGGDDRHLHSAPKAEAIDDATPAQAAPLPDQIGATGLNAQTVAVEAPVDPQAANVATQIAQQVDFYKLPGNKGVRIQLHPDDLGGVQVTLRYAPGGNLELHINVEHAATGSLVEAGWSQLRDALATQGFEPDRLVMSVSGPASANQLDFSSSNGNGAYRQDSGLAGFMQDGQSGQQRNGADDPRATTRGWSSAAEPVGAIDDSPRNVSSAGSAASRIDYRV
jgi:flagellar hook-length control protein FliK